MKDEDILSRIQAIVEKNGDGKIECPQALELAKDLGVPSLDIARVLNHNSIKIKACQLGCFK